MAYNNGFPVNYQYYPQNQFYGNNQPLYNNNIQQPQYNNVQQQTITPPTIHAEIIQVDNEQAAVDFPLSAGCSQMMIARDDSAIFVKTMYANGQYNLDVFSKRPASPKKKEIDPDIYITREEFESRLNGLMEAYRDKPKQAVKKAAPTEKEGEQ